MDNDKFGEVEYKSDASYFSKNVHSIFWNDNENDKYSFVLF